MKLSKKFMAASVMALAIGMTATGVTAFADSAPSVTIDGQAVTFSDAVPQNVNGRIMVPYRAMFEALGAEVDYDAATKVISGSVDGKTLEMTNGNNVITIKNADGTTSTKTMDVAPFIQNDRTFVPTRFVSEVLGYSVGWDQAAKTVVIVNTDKIVADANTDFALLRQTADISVDNSKTYNVDGTFKGNLTMDLSSLVGNGTASAEELKASMDLDGTVKGICNNTDADITVDMNLSDGETKVPASSEVKLDGNKGVMYMGQTVNGNQTWYSMSMDSVLGAQGMSWSDLKNATAASDDMVAGMSATLKAMAPSYDVNGYQRSVDYYNALKKAFGDDAFKKSGNTYTSEFDFADMFKAMGTSSQMDGATVTGKYVIETDGTKPVSSTMTMKMGGVQGLNEMSVEATTKKNSAVAKFVADMLGMKMTGDIDLKFTETSNKVDTSLPKGVTAVSLDSMLNAA